MLRTLYGPWQGKGLKYKKTTVCLQINSYYAQLDKQSFRDIPIMNLKFCLIVHCASSVVFSFLSANTYLILDFWQNLTFEKDCLEMSHCIYEFCLHFLSVLDLNQPRVYPGFGCQPRGAPSGGMYSEEERRLG